MKLKSLVAKFLGKPGSAVVIGLETVGDMMYNSLLWML